MISNWSLVALAIIVFLNTAAIGGIAIALWMLNRKVDQITEQLTPLINRATDTVASVEKITADLHVKLDHVMDTVEDTVKTVSQRVDTTTAIAEETISQPLIGAASVMAGLSRGLRTYKERAAEKGEGDGTGT